MSRQDESRNADLKRAFEDAADKIAREMRDIKRLRDEIMEYCEGVKKGLTDSKPGHVPQGSQQIGEMNNNLKNLVELSKNHI
jgi:hypothetical protein